MDLASLTAAAEATRVLFGLAKGAASAAVDHQLKDRLIEIQQGILDVQSKLGDAQAERMDLLHEVGELRDKLRSALVSRAALDSYELCPMGDGKYLYKARTNAGHAVEHHACPACHNNGRVSILQEQSTGSRQTRYRCFDSVCGFDLYVGPSDPMAPRRLVGKVMPRDW